MKQDRDMPASPYQFRCSLAIAAVAVFLFSLIGQSAAALDEASVYSVQSETANLILTRTDFSSQKVPVIQRYFRRQGKERGLFGAGWCSNLDLALTGVDESAPARIELVDCEAGRTRGFRKLLEAWIENSSGSRILKAADGKWQMTDAPYAIFRPDGKLDSFMAENQVRWHVRRDSAANIEALDNLKERPIKFRRGGTGDLEAILDGRGHAIAKYRITTMLQYAEVAGVSESYEYDSDLNVLKLLRNEAGQASRLWRFSYTATEWVSTVNHPDGCISKWVFDRQVTPYVAKETKTCHEETLGTAKPVVALGDLKRKLASSSSAATESKSAPTPVLMRPGALGVGTEKATVTLGREGLPVLFEILGTNGQVRRIEIVREAGSGTTQVVRTRGVEVNFNKKPRAYDDAQLELLDDYENWISAWGSR